MGCRHYFVVDRLEALVDEGDSRSSSRVREHGSFRLVSQLQVAIQTPLKSMSISSSCVIKLVGCPLTTGRPVLTSICICVFVCVFVFLSTFNKQFDILAAKREMCVDFLSTRTGRFVLS